METGKNQTSKSRAFSFTHFLAENEKFEMPPTKGKLVRYVWQEEESPTTKKRHIQGYCAFENPRSWKSLQKDFVKAGRRGVHIECSKGSAAKNYAYCTKLESRVSGGQHAEMGDFPEDEQGKRNDWAALYEMARTNASELELLHAFPALYGPHVRGVQSIRFLTDSVRRCSWDQMDCRWYCGKSNTGKTSSVYDEFPKCYSKDPTTCWWDGYLGEPVVLIDDYRPNAGLSYADLLRIAQPYPLRAQVKGAYVQVKATTIIVTSNHWPWELFPTVEFDPAAFVHGTTPLVRRFEMVAFPPPAVPLPEAAEK